MFSRKFQKKLAAFFEPIMRIDEGRRKIKKIIEPYKGEYDFQCNAPLSELQEILDITAEAIRIKKDQGYRKIEERELHKNLKSLIYERTMNPPGSRSYVVGQFFFFFNE